MKIQTESIYIATFWPLKTDVIQRPSASNPSGGTTRYSLPIYSIEDFEKKAPPKMLEIPDSWQAKLDIHTREHEAANLVSAESRGRDLVKHWAVPDSECKNGGKPGIWIASGESLKFDCAEAREAMDDQMAYIEWLYYKGQEYAEAKQWNLIGDRHRVAGMWLKKEEPWVKNLVVESIHTCPACGSTVKPGAYICATCTYQVRDFPPDMAARFIRQQQQRQGQQARA